MDSNKYTGKLFQPRDLQSTTIGDLTMAKTTVGPMDNNCYFLARGSQCMLIDACADADHLLAVASNLGAHIRVLVTTHQHADHVGALAEVLAATDAVHISTAVESDALPVPADITVADGDLLSEVTDAMDFGNATLRCIELHGHTPAGLAIAVETQDPTHLFVGDSLFPGGVGKTHSPEQFNQLFDDVTSRLFEKYPDDTFVHPGHGADTTLGNERPNLAQWRARGR